MSSVEIDTPDSVVKNLTTANGHIALRRIYEKIAEIKSAIPGTVDYEAAISLDLGVKLNYNERVGIVIIMKNIGWENIDIKGDQMLFYFPVTDV